jgi:hypothetical protein
VYYINMMSRFGRETVGEYDTRKEAQRDCIAWAMADPTSIFYVSTRCCNSWREDTKESGK